MSDNALAVQETREITPAIWQMLTQIPERAEHSQMKRYEAMQKLLFCYENGLPLNLAFNGGMYTVNGRLEVEGNVIRAQIRKHPHYDYKIVALDETICTMAITYDGETIGEVTFTIEDAKRIIDGKTNKPLAEKYNWKNYPADMLLNRATSRAYKRFCPDIFFTPVYVRGEIEADDMLDETEYAVIEGEIVQSVDINPLIQEYGADAVLRAMGNNPPQTQQELKALKDLLDDLDDDHDHGNIDGNGPFPWGEES